MGSAFRASGGTLLFQGIRGSDYFLVQGIVFIVIVAISLATLILDLTYPLLDPRTVSPLQPM